MTFGDALQVLREGNQIRRRSWDRKHRIVLKNDNLFMVYANPEHTYALNIAGTDLLADDWEEFFEPVTE